MWLLCSFIVRSTHSLYCSLSFPNNCHNVLVIYESMNKDIMSYIHTYIWRYIYIYVVGNRGLPWFMFFAFLVMKTSGILFFGPSFRQPARKASSGEIYLKKKYIYMYISRTILLYHTTCKPDFLSSCPSLNSYLK